MLIKIPFDRSIEVGSAYSQIAHDFYDWEAIRRYILIYYITLFENIVKASSIERKEYKK